jgi:hypothetical protein
MTPQLLGYPEQPPASTLGREAITISVFMLVEGRKRRDSNPRTVSGLSLSSSAWRRTRAVAGDATAGHSQKPA